MLMIASSPKWRDVVTVSLLGDRQGREAVLRASVQDVTLLIELQCAFGLANEVLERLPEERVIRLPVEN